MESRNLLRLRGDVRFLGDAEGLTLRHPDADLNRRINAQIRGVIAFITANGGRFFLTSTAAATLASTRVSGEQYSEVAWPPTAVEVHGVDVESSAGLGDWRSLRPISWGQRRDSTTSYGAPAFWAVRLIPQGDGATGTTAGAVTIWPFAASGQYKIWFIPDFVDMDSDTDVFLGLPAWHDWVVWSVVQDLSARDDDQRETFSISTQKKEEAEQRILEAIGRVEAGGPLRPRRPNRGRFWRR